VNERVEVNVRIAQNVRRTYIPLTSMLRCLYKDI